MSLAACNGSDNAPTTPVASVAPTGIKATLAVLETTDLYINVPSYDYFKLTADNSLGFERMAMLINQAHTQFPSTLLLDNGDIIQDTTLSDYQAMVSPVTCDQMLATCKVMNTVKYGGSGIGNHEFNHGLPYLPQVMGNTSSVDGLPDPAMQKRCAGPAFPQMLVNVVSTETNASLSQPYTITIKTVTVTAPDGSTIDASAEAGIISFVPPTIASWDRH